MQTYIRRIPSPWRGRRGQSDEVDAAQKPDVKGKANDELRQLQSELKRCQDQLAELRAVQAPAVAASSAKQHVDEPTVASFDPFPTFARAGGDESKTSPAAAVAPASAGATRADRRQPREMAVLQSKIDGLVSEARNAPVVDGILEWDAEGWLKGLDVHSALALALLRSFGGDASTIAGEQQLHFLRSLGEHQDARRMLQEGLLGDIANSMTDILYDGLQTLCRARAATAKQLVNKFRSEDKAREMQFGSLSTYLQGLEALIGQPSPNFVEAMAREHCQEVDSTALFTTSNYEMTTTSATEWWFVYDPDEGLQVLGINGWPVEQKLLAAKARGQELAGAEVRKPVQVSVLRRRGKRICEKLKTLAVAPLLDAEIIGARLYTGPMFEKYNSVLRRFTQAPFLVETFNRLCAGNTYTTTIHAINSALVKLSKVTTAGTVYRGIGGGALPSQFLEPDEFQLCSAVDYGFMSTSCTR